MIRKNMIAASILRVFLVNLLVAATVFLPLLLAGAKLTSMTYYGLPLAAAGFLYELSGAVLLYVGMSVPVFVGVLAHSAALSLFLWVPSVRALQLATVALAPLVPATPLALAVIGHVVFTDNVGATAVATLAYGLASAKFSLKSRAGSESAGRH